MSNLAPIFEPWAGNAEALAADLSLQGVTVRQWRNRENIPPAYWQAIIDAAEKRGHSLHWQQFVVKPPKAQAAA